MVCKNCNIPLHEGANYCAKCGAKVIANRLTFKHLSAELIANYLNVDNTFLRTFLALFSKPEIVICGYIDGVRKKYLNPVSYIAIALTITGILVFFMRRTFPEGFDFDILKTGMYDAAASKRMSDFIFTFYSLIFILYIPILALSSWLTFNREKYLYTEHIIIFMYAQAHYSLITSPLTILILFITPELYLYSSFLFMVFMVGYALYVLKRIPSTAKSAFVIRAFLFLIFFGFGYFTISIIQFILMLLTGTLSIADFIPKSV